MNIVWMKMKKIILLIGIIMVLLISGCIESKRKMECDNLVLYKTTMVTSIPDCGSNPEKYYCCFGNSKQIPFGSMYYSDELKLKICEKYPEAKEQYSDVCK